MSHSHTNMGDGWNATTTVNTYLMPTSRSTFSSKPLIKLNLFSDSTGKKQFNDFKSHKRCTHISTDTMYIHYLVYLLPPILFYIIHEIWPQILITHESSLWTVKQSTMSIHSLILQLNLAQLMSDFWKTDTVCTLKTATTQYGLTHNSCVLPLLTTARIITYHSWSITLYHQRCADLSTVSIHIIICI